MTKVVGIKPGDRVYVSPVRSCGSCPSCLKGERTQCQYMTFNGYFGFQENSDPLRHVSAGGFCEYMSAPQYAIVKLPDSVSFREATRLGYWGTAYSALKKAGSLCGTSILINGISGTLGIGATLIALARGATRIFGTGRNSDLLTRVKALAPERIEVFSTDDGSIADWVRSRTGGIGCDLMLDTLGAVASHGVRRGGRIINIGGTAGKLPIDLKWLMDEQMTLIGSVWFTTAEGYELVRRRKAYHSAGWRLSWQNEDTAEITVAPISVGGEAAAPPALRFVHVNHDPAHRGTRPRFKRAGPGFRGGGCRRHQTAGGSHARAQGHRVVRPAARGTSRLHRGVEGPSRAGHPLTIRMTRIAPSPPLECDHPDVGDGGDCRRLRGGAFRPLAACRTPDECRDRRPD